MEKFKSKESNASNTMLKLTNMTLSVSTIALHASLPLLYAKWGLSYKTAYAMALFSIATPVMYTAIDKFTSPTNSYEKNSKIIAKNDYSKSRINSYLLINGAITHIGLFLGAYKGIGYKVPKFDYKIPLIFLTNAAVAEIMFFPIHRALHKNEKLAYLHVLHHCLKYPGWLGSILFNPIDLIIELSPVVISVVSTHALLFENKFATALSAGLLYAWYICDHEENLRLPHTKHHLTINGIYGVYTDRDAGTKGELVRHKIKK